MRRGHLALRSQRSAFATERLCSGRKQVALRPECRDSARGYLVLARLALAQERLALVLHRLASDQQSPRAGLGYRTGPSAGLGDCRRGLCRPNKQRSRNRPRGRCPQEWEGVWNALRRQHHVPLQRELHRDMWECLLRPPCRSSGPECRNRNRAGNAQGEAEQAFRGGAAIWRGRCRGASTRDNCSDVA